MNPKDLRKKTNEAVKRGKDKAEAARQLEADRKRLRLNVARAWADNRMAEIPALAEEAAEAGQLRCVVASTRECMSATNPARNGAWQEFHGWNLEDNHGLKFSLLCEALEKAEFKVDVVYEHDGVGMFSWYEVVISWAE